MALGVGVAVAGVVTSFHADTPSGGTIVVLAIVVFLLALAATGVRRKVTARTAG
jgi:zinc transport system permease protein